MIDSYNQLLEDTKRYLLQLKNEEAVILSNQEQIATERPSLSSQKASIFSLPKEEYKPQKEIFQPSQKKKPEEKKEIPQPVQSKKDHVPSRDHFHDLKSIMSKFYPNLTLHENPLSDKRAQERKQQWKLSHLLPKVPILVDQETKIEKEFLSHVALAIEKNFISSRVFSIQKMDFKKLQNLFENNQVTFLIVSQDTLKKSQYLLSHYQSIPNENKHFIHHIPTLIIEKPLSYMENPSKKKKLWHHLKQIFN